MIESRLMKEEKPAARSKAPGRVGLAALLIGAISLSLASNGPGKVEPGIDSLTAGLLNKRLFQCMLHASDLELELQERYSSGGALEDRKSIADAASPASRLSTALEQLHLIQEQLDQRYRLMLDGEGRLADELYSVDYYTAVIESRSSTQTERSSAFLHLSYLDNGSNYMAGLEQDWIRQVLRTRDEEDMLRLVASAARIPRNATIKSILLREANSTSDLVRSEALRALGKYPDEDAWSMIQAGLDDGSAVVRNEAKDQLSRRR